jgi:hypothetical protein
MKFLRRLFGFEDEPQKPQSARQKANYGHQAAAEGFEFGGQSALKYDAFTGDSREINTPPGPPPDILSEEQAIQRYRYLLQTAPPETLERGHVEAFTRMAQSQRARILQELAATLPEETRATLNLQTDDPAHLAQTITRVERSAPGLLEQTMGGPAAGMGGGMLAGTLFAGIAVGFVESEAARQFFANLTREAGVAAGESREM